MKIFFDCRFIRVDHHDGISRFSSELFSALSTKTKLTAILSDIRQLRYLPEGTKYLMANPPTNPLAELLLPLRLNRLGAEVVFSPMQTMGSLGRKYRLVLTLHDLIYYYHQTPPSFLSPPIRLAWWLFHQSFWPQRYLLNRADAIVTVSETTKGLMLRHNLTKKPISVVYNAADNVYSKASLAGKSKPGGKILLYMGSFMDYKNVEFLIKAMAKLPEYKILLLSGISKKRKAELEALIDRRGGKVEFLDGVSEAEYINLLDQATALVSASKEEGFGIPVVEAISRGVPVVLSDIPIFHEVAQSAGSYFSTESEFVEAVLNLEESEHWKVQSQRAQERGKDFSWEKSADELLRILTSLRE